VIKLEEIVDVVNSIIEYLNRTIAILKTYVVFVD
ncbi:unnamed protein product, partial [marine sediment metagenome]